MVGIGIMAKCTVWLPGRLEELEYLGSTAVWVIVEIEKKTVVQWYAQTR